MMRNSEINAIARHPVTLIGHTRWGELERADHPVSGTQICYYCNCSLKCGQQQCIWREEGV